MKNDKFRESDTFKRELKSYRRPDAFIAEEIFAVLRRLPGIDASNLKFNVNNGDVTLFGSVLDRGEKLQIERMVEKIFGVRDVFNMLTF
jgi:osmotically-inducible protein OsmY